MRRPTRLRVCLCFFFLKFVSYILIILFFFLQNANTNEHSRCRFVRLMSRYLPQDILLKFL